MGDQGSSWGFQWTPLRHRLDQHPKVLRIYNHLRRKGTLPDLSQDHGLLLVGAAIFRVWCSANEHTAYGFFEGIERQTVDIMGTLEGLCEAMEEVGWARVHPGGVELPEFCKFNSPNKSRQLVHKDEKRLKAQIEEANAKAKETGRGQTGDKPGTNRGRFGDTSQTDAHPDAHLDIASPSGDAHPIAPEKGSKSGRLPPGFALELLKRWNHLPEGVTRHRTFNAKWTTQLRARWNEAGGFWRENWEAALQKVAEIPAMRGLGQEKALDNGRKPFRATLEWFLRRETVQKLVEGFYDTWGRDQAIDILSLPSKVGRKGAEP